MASYCRFRCSHLRVIGTACVAAGITGIATGIARVARTAVVLIVSSTGVLGLVGLIGIGGFAGFVGRIICGIIWLIGSGIALIVVSAAGIGGG